MTLNYNNEELGWDDIKTDAELLLELLKQHGGQRPLARKLGIDHKSIKYWMDKYEITVDDYGNYKGTKHGKQEHKPDVVEKDDFYIVHGSDYPIEISKDKLSKFRKLYCGRTSSEYLTLNQCARELEMTRKDLYAVKTAFGITHDSVPYSERELKDKSTSELAEESLNRKKKEYFKKLRQQEYEDAVKKLKKYQKKDFFFERTTDEIIDKLETIDYRPPELYELGMEKPDRKTLVININDWHKGKLVLENDLIGSSMYNKEKFEKIISKYIKEIIYLIELHDPEEIYILNYGDGPDDPNGETYDLQRLNQDIKAEKQLLDYIEDLKEFILAIYDYQPNITYVGVPGNHSKGLVNWDALANQMLSKMLSNYDTIEFDVSKIKHKVIEIYDSRIIQTHGEDIRTGTNTGENDILNMINMEQLPYKKTYVVHAHLHHERVEGTNYKRIYLPSPVGGDNLSNNILYTTSRPAQIAFLVTEEGIKQEHHIYFDC